MTSYMCKTCGTQYTPSINAPEACIICENDRQFIGKDGQEWTTLHELQQDHQVSINKVSTTLYELSITPGFAIGQRAFLHLSEKGNVLWDCLPLLTDEAIAFIQDKGGLSAIAISHPHYYSSMNEWAKTFKCPVYLHHADKEWICRKDEEVKFILWEGENINLPGNLTLYNTRGHFPGSAILLIPEQEGILLTGDSIYVNPDRKTVSMMYSYPNFIPLNREAILFIRDLVAPLQFDKMYSAFSFGNITTGAKEAFLFSADRYLKIYT